MYEYSKWNQAAGKAV